MSAPQAAETTPAPEPKRVFSSKRIYTISIPGPDGEVAYRVRFPTDAEWCTRARRLIAVRRNLGRDATQTEYRDELPIGLELVEKLLAEGSPKPDEWDAKTILDELQLCELSPETGQADTFYLVEMKVLRATVRHRLKVPTQKQIGEYNRESLRATGRRNSVEYRSPLEPSGELWDRLQIGVEGYDDISSVPIIHKKVAVEELIAQIQNRVHAGIDPED